MTEELAPEVAVKPKKTFWGKFFIFLILAIVFGGLIFAAILGAIRINNQTTNTNDGPPGPARNYSYPTPSAAAKNRTINCNKDLRIYRVNPKKVLCLNLYKTSPQEISTKMANTSYDNIVLYGQNLFFDVATNINKPSNFSEQIYNTAKFNDLIALPKMMALYGVSNLNYINKDYSPYPAIYYEVRNQAEVNKNCSSQFNVGGCSMFHFLIVLLEDAITNEDQISKYVSWSRNETDDHLFYRQTVPEDCYLSHITVHETAHTLLFARELRIEGISMTGNTNKTPKWFNEEQAGMMSIIGFEQICGKGIISETAGTFARKTKDANFLKFQSVFPSKFIAGGGTDTECQKGILTSFYRYLSKEKIESRMPKLMGEIREKSKIKGFLSNDKNFAKLILRFLNNDPKEKEFLNSKACGI